MITAVSHPQSPQLDYALPPPLVQRARFRRRLALAGVALAILSSLWWGPPLWRNARAVYWQRQCMAYAARPGCVVYDEDVAQGRMATEVRVPAWDALYPFIKYAGPPRPQRAVLFLHALRHPTAGVRLVEVELAHHNDEVEELALRDFVPHPAALSEPPQARVYENWLRLPGLRGARRLRFYAGRPDPADPSRFTIPYEIDGRAGALDGRLDDDGGIIVHVREGGAAGPR
jgi:hypothetical protein